MSQRTPHWRSTVRPAKDHSVRALEKACIQFLGYYNLPGYAHLLDEEANAKTDGNVGGLDALRMNLEGAVEDWGRTR